MKKIVLWVTFLFVIMLAVAVGVAFKFGEKSPIYAEGRISLSDELTYSAGGIRTLFITLFDEESDRPMPYGAMREQLKSDPAGDFFHFKITKEKLQVMAPDGHLPKYFRIKVRLDRDGQGGMDQPGDLTGEIKTVAFGSKNLALHINTKVR